MADLLGGRSLGWFDLEQSCLGRRVGSEGLPTTASLPGIPVWPGVHLMVSLQSLCHFSVIQRMSWKMSIR